MECTVDALDALTTWQIVIKYETKKLSMPCEPCIRYCTISSSWNAVSMEVYKVHQKNRVPTGRHSEMPEERKMSHERGIFQYRFYGEVAGHIRSRAMATKCHMGKIGK